MDKQVRRVTYFFLVSFLLLIGNLTYLQIFAAERIASHPKNTRDLKNELQIPRGNIISSDGVVLATNKQVGASYERVYPHGSLTSGVVGFSNTRYGRSGLEQSFNSYLLGKKKLATLDDYIDQIKEKQIGSNLHLTLDVKLQQAATRALGNRKGAVVAIEPQTGALLTLVTYPRYDPNQLDSRWEGLVSSPHNPLINRGVQGLYPPGSAFKVLTSAAALETQVTTPEKTYNGPRELRVHGGTVTNYADQGFGLMPFGKALVVSCNTIFAQVGLELEAGTLVEFAQQFGLNRDVPFDLPVERSTIPASGQMDKLELAWTAVGQGRVLTTPFEVALIGAAIANDGRIMRPYVVREVRDHKGTVLHRVKDKVWARPISKETAHSVRDLMVRVVTEGTGTRANIAGVSVAGKTGTAEPAEKKRPHAWFVAFAPAEDPEIAVAVVVEHGGVGGTVAAPVAKQVIEAAMRR